MRAELLICLLAMGACSGPHRPPADVAGRGVDMSDCHWPPEHRDPDAAWADVLTFDGIEAADLGMDALPAVPVIELFCPAEVKGGQGAPIVLRVLHGDGVALDIQGTAHLVVEGGKVVPDEVEVRHGVGSVTAVISGGGPVILRAKLGEVCGQRDIVLGAGFKKVEVAGALGEDQLAWEAGQEVQVTGDLEVPAGRKLEIAAGVRVRVAAKANIRILGEIDVRGTADQPVLFTAATESPWGGIIHEKAPGRYERVLFTNGGGDSSRVFGHSKSQPVLYMENSKVELFTCALLDNPGKAMGGQGARLTIEDSLVSRCDTGGELKKSQVSIRRCHFLEFPSSDGVSVDDDNDGIYLSGEMTDGDGSVLPSLVEGCVFAVGKDDGIDHNGATVTIRDTIIEAFIHEGIACSKGGRVDVINTLVRHCEQGIEAGYGAPQVFVDHCLLTDNETGFRFGDSYDWEADGMLTVTNSISVLNDKNNVRNFVVLLDGPLKGRIDISYSIVDDPEWDGVSGNLPGLPVFDSTWHLLAGSIGQGAASDGLDVGLLP